MLLTTTERDTPTMPPPGDSCDRWVRAGYYDPAFADHVNRELDRLSELKLNWDAQGAEPIDPTVIDAARRFVTQLPKNLIWSPAVVPMAKGNLQFEWHEGPRSLELEFDDTHTVHYLKWHPEEDVEEEGTFPTTETSRAGALIRWFTRGVANV